MQPALQQLQAFANGRQAGRETQADAAGLPLQVREGAGLSAYGWRGGELTSITEPDGTRFDYRYGEDGRLLEVLRDGATQVRYRYDAVGRLAAIDRDANPLAHDYDAQGRLVRTRRGDAGSWLYRWAGQRVTEARSEREASRFEHDTGGRLVGITQTVDGLALSLRQQFDAAGRLASIDFPDWGQRITFGWDTRNRPVSVRWNGAPVVRLGSDDARRLSWQQSADGQRAVTWHEAGSGRAVRQWFGHRRQVLREIELERDAQFRLVREGERRYRYDAHGRLAEADGHAYRYDACGNAAVDAELHFDRHGNVASVRRAGEERVYRYNGAHELTSLLVDGECVAHCAYDHKGRLVLKTGPAGAERYLYGPDDALLAVADGQGRPLLIVLRLPTGIVGLVDFRHDANGQARTLLCDHGGNLIHADVPLRYSPFGVPDSDGEAGLPPIFRGRLWHTELGLYRIGSRWYDPRLARFLTPDSHTGAPDDERLVNPFVPAVRQRMARARCLGEWLREPALRNRHAYCSNDPVNRFDPNGHWSFGGVLLSLLGVLWTLPNTAFGLAIEVSCLIGEVVRWLVYAVTLGHVSWQTPGFDVASSSRLDAFALVFKGGWIGSFESLLGITFGNVIFVNGEYEEHPAFKALPDPVAPPAYNGTVTIPKAQALYEHELRHVNQYSWWGPFFHLGLPLFGIYEWDVILNGYQDASLEKDAREHGGF
ncbi:MAG: RHS repeat-associated core domain-containing protein [Burkholderiales bacterium]|jgi:RHS repeat-associated protein|nr:RHS repeat-associated core domain-containing protein [Burkholderiales bacterium]